MRNNQFKITGSGYSIPTSWYSKNEKNAKIDYSFSYGNFEETISYNSFSLI